MGVIDGAGLIPGHSALSQALRRAAGQLAPALLAALGPLARREIHRSAAAEAAPSAGGRPRLIGEGRVRQEVVQRGLDLRKHQVVVAARLPDALPGGLQCQQLAIGIAQTQAVDVSGVGLRQAVGQGLLSVAQAGAGHAHVPLVGRIRRVQIGDGAPAHGAHHRVADALRRADGRQVGFIAGRVACRADQRALGSASAHAQGKDSCHVAGQQPFLQAGVADGRLEVRHTGGRACVTAPGPRKGQHEARVRVIADAAVPAGGRIVRGGRHGRVARGVHRQDDGCGQGRVAADCTIGVHGAGVGAVAVVRGVHVRPGNEEAHGFPFGIGRTQTVAQAYLPVEIMLGVVLPAGHIEERQTVVRVFRQRGAARHQQRRAQQQACCPSKGCFHGRVSSFMDASARFPGPRHATILP